MIGTVAGGILSAMGLARVSYAASGTKLYHTTFSQGLRSPLFQGGGFGIGYTGGAYAGYGATNTADPFGLHKPKYKYKSYKLGMPYGRYGYRRFRRYRRYGSRYGYRRRSYYRRRYY